MSRAVSRSAMYAVLIILALLFLIPLYVMVVTSLKPFDQVSLEHMWQLPKSLNFSSYSEALNQLLPNLLNTIYLVIPCFYQPCLVH